MAAGPDQKRRLAAAPERRVECLKLDFAKLIFVLVPKCGSTTVINSFIHLAGLDPSAFHVRLKKHADRRDPRLASAGLGIALVTLSEVRAFTATHPDYKLLTCVRDPYDRVVSNYFSKIHRLCLVADRNTYFRSKIFHLFGGPKACPHIDHANRYIRRRITFPQYLEMLRTAGTEFDSHFAQQSKLLQMDRTKFDHVFQLETLDRDFVPTLSSLGVPDIVTARLPRMAHFNVAGDRGKAGHLQPQELATIARLYARDFETLGYPL